MRWIKAIATGLLYAHLVDHYSGDRCILRGFRRLP
jgi:hypothetical protein